MRVKAKIFVERLARKSIRGMTWSGEEVMDGLFGLTRGLKGMYIEL